MVLKYHISPSIINEDFIVKIWEAASDGPGNEVATINIPKDGGGGHPAPYTVIQNGLDMVVHIVRMYTASAQLLHEYNAEPRVDVVTVFAPIRFKIGDGGALTPAQGTQVYQNDILKQFTDDEFVIIRNGYGALLPGVHYTHNPVLGAWTLLNDDAFNGVTATSTGEEFTMMMSNKVVTSVVNDSVVGKWFGGFVDIVANTNYIPANLRKLHRFIATSIYEFTTAPIGYAFVFQNFSGAGVIGTVKFTNGPLKWGGTTKATIDLPLYSEACFTWDGAQWNVVYMTDTSFVNGATTIQPGQTIAVGSTNFGNVPNGADIHTVTHNLNIAGDYMVFLSCKGTVSTAAADANVIVSWRHHLSTKPNAFHVITQEVNGGGVNNITVCWLIIKI